MGKNPNIAAKLRKMYQSHYLIGNIASCALKKGVLDDQFAEFQLKEFNKLDIEKVLCENIVVDCAKHNVNWTPTGDFFGGENANLNGLRQTYEKVVDTDVFSKQVFEYQGNVIGLTDLQPYEAWYCEEIYKKVLMKFNIKEVTAVAFPRPLHCKEVIVFNFLRELERPLWFDISRDQIIAFLLPFYFCWLYRFGWIDEAHLNAGLHAISGHTPTQIRALRTVCSTNSLAKDELGKIYGGVTGSPESSYGSLVKMLRRILDEPVGPTEKRKPAGYYTLKCRDLYKMLNFTGNSSALVEQEIKSNFTRRVQSGILLSQEN